MSKFFVNSGNIIADKILITGDDVKHIKNVLRLHEGDAINICDGLGIDYKAEIERFGPDSITTNVTEKKSNKTEPPVYITLYQGIPKSDKMEFIIQKCIELGVKKIVPVITERTVVRFESQKDKEKKTARWNKIAEEASKQCNRGVIPEVEMPVLFREAIKNLSYEDLALIPYENETDNKLKSILRISAAKSVSVFIGPEGGFTANEIEEAVINKVIPVTLGPRILRTETAGMSVISIIMYEIGDINL